MAKEASAKPHYRILAYLTINKEREVTGAPLFIRLESEKELTETTQDIARALKADVVRLRNNDFMLIYL